MKLFSKLFLAALLLFVVTAPPFPAHALEKSDFYGRWINEEENTGGTAILFTTAAVETPDIENVHMTTYSNCHYSCKSTPYRLLYTYGKNRNITGARSVMILNGDDGGFIWKNTMRIKIVDGKLHLSAETDYNEEHEEYNEKDKDSSEEAVFRRFGDADGETDEVWEVMTGEIAAAGEAELCHEDYHTSDRFTKLLFEFDYQEGQRPDEEAIEIFTDYVSRFMDKPGGIEYIIDDELSAIQVKALSMGNLLAYRDYYHDGPEMAVYIVYKDGEGKRGFGYAKYNWSTITISQGSINFYKPMIGKRKINWSDVEAAILIHELGHHLGITWHCDDPRCIMAGFSPEKANNVAKIIIKERRIPYQFCPVCRKVFEQYRNGKLKSRCMRNRLENE
ncbi:hypothetical protein ACFLQK_01915 [bacterium]